MTNANHATVNELLNNKRNRLFIVLCGIFLTNAIIAELIGVKLFSLEQSMGFNPAQIPLFAGNVLDFNLTAGVMLWPVVFITTDIINEYFGKKGVKTISLLTVALIGYGFLMIALVTNLTPAQFWLDLNNTDPNGQAFDMDFAFNKVYTQGMSIIVASMVAFLIGQLLDVFIFQQLRRRTGSKMIWLRATGSTLVSQLIDSFVVLFIAFYVAGNWPMSLVLSVCIVNYIYKFIVAITLTPVLYVVHNIIDRYLGKEQANAMANEATAKSKGFF